MREANEGGRKLSGVFAVAAGLMFATLAAQLVHVAAGTSATVDEGAHILASHRHVQCGDFGINPEHPPLQKLIVGLTISYRDWIEPGWECGSRLTPKPEMFDAGTKFIVANGIDTVVVPARLGASLLTLALAVLVFLAAWEMFGRAAAIIALALVAFEPSIIGNGAYVLTDVPVSATAFAAAYSLYRYGRKKTWARLAVAGLAVGLMLATKHSAVVFVPVFFLLLFGDNALFPAADERRSARLTKALATYAAVFAIGFVLLWASYGFRYSSIPRQGHETVSVAEYIKVNGRPEMVDTFSAKFTDLINRAHLLPEAYTLGMADVIAWGSRNSFFLGKTYPTGKWFYFPVAFFSKSSLPLLLLLPLGLALPFLFPDKRREALYLHFPALAYFGIAMTSAMTIGIRHLLPVYPFFIVAAAGGAAWLLNRYAWAKYALALLLLYHVATAARITPEHAAFMNDLWGGPANVHRVFADANAGFGQDLKSIAAYTERNGITDCWIAAFNHADLQRAMTPCRVLPSGLRILVSRDVIEPLPDVIEGTVFLSNNELPPRGGNEYVPITAGEQIDFLGGTIHVYRGRFEIPLAAAMSRAYRSGQLLEKGSTAEALDEARRSVELAPDDPRTHLALGLAMLKSGQPDPAAEQFRTTIRLAKDRPQFRNAEVRATLELERLTPASHPSP